MLEEKNLYIQIIGCLLKQPSILGQTDKYALSLADFHNTFYRKVFGIIFNLYERGAKSVSAIDIENVLKENPTNWAVWEKENGHEFLDDAEALSDLGNFDYYYNRMKKVNLLFELKKLGYDTSRFYVETIITDEDKKINELFDSLKPQDIVNALRRQITGAETRAGITQENKVETANFNVAQLIQNLKNEPDTGARLQGKIFNTMVRGARKGKFYLRTASSGTGKALPNYTKIPTPSGWKTVGEVQVGDYLFDRCGQPTKVLAVYPQQEVKRIYKVYFKSGRVAECCEEHLWSYYSTRNDKNPDKLITTTIKDLYNNKKGLQNGDGAYRWAIPICQPVQYEEKKYSIDPYVMGLILGDGSFRYDNSQKGFYFSSSDEELVKAIQERMGYKLYKKNSQHNYNWSFEFSEWENHKNVWVEDILYCYPELWQAKSENKFIPPDFLFGSIQQRYDLLAGLLDTDGSIDDKGRVRFTTVSPKMRDNVIELCESLGMICTYGTDKRTFKYTTGECYNIHIQASKEDKKKIFKLSRKKEKADKYCNNTKREDRKDRDAIVKIEPTDVFSEMTCFYVDNPEHLFLMNNFICTHNTRTMVGDACYLAYPIRYNNDKQAWEWAGACEKVLYIATEQELDEIQTMIVAYLSGVNENKILFGTYDSEEEKIIQKAIWLMDTYSDNLTLARMANPNISQLQYMLRQQVLENDIGYVFYDYIFSNPALLNEFRDLRIREDVALGLMGSALKDLAVELNVFILSSTQTNAQVEDGGRQIKNESVIRGARSLADKVDMGCIMARPTDEEIHKLETLSNIRPNLVTDIYKMRRGKYTQVRIWSLVDLGTCRRTDLFATDQFFKRVDIGELKQEYVMEDTTWNIQKTVVDLNTGEILPPVEKKEKLLITDQLLEKIQEKKGDPFVGLI